MEISTVGGINKLLCSYMTHHGFANYLKHKGVTTDLISELMEPQNLTVSQAYLKEFESSVFDIACEMLL